MILNQQKSVRIPVRALEKFFAQAMNVVRLPRDAASICFVTNSQIKKWNAAYRGKNKPTDVLSFPADEASNSKPRPSYLGDIAIAPAVAQKYAKRHGRSLDQELRILILHGILHLMGYDHETDTGQMDRREQRLRRTLGIA